MSKEIITLRDIAEGLKAGLELSSFIGKIVILTGSGPIMDMPPDKVILPADGGQYHTRALFVSKELHPALRHVLATTKNTTITGRIIHMEAEMCSDHRISPPGAILADHKHVEMLLDGIQLQTIESLRKMIESDE